MVYPSVSRSPLVDFPFILAFCFPGLKKRHIITWLNPLNAVKLAVLSKRPFRRYDWFCSKKRNRSDRGPPVRVRPF